MYRWQTPRPLFKDPSPENHVPVLCLVGEAVFEPRCSEHPWVGKRKPVDDL